jgi:2-amino-1-hydroxyethylphosphonate dioxygenase (glycine-forming)
MTVDKARSVADEIISLYEKYGSEDYIGEPVSQIEHMTQCAALAEESGADNDVVLAAFFHDIGHFCEHLHPAENMQGFGVVDHEKLGADYLRERGFSDTISKLVISHVAAKRYLTFKYPPYYHNLSEASKRTLDFQGGRMTEAEAVAFENDPLFEQYIQLRRWDEQAKEEHVPLPSLQKFHSRIVHHLTEAEVGNSINYF